MTDYFTDLSDSSLAKLEQSSSTRAVAEGTLIFLEDQPGEEIFRLLSGSVRLFRTTPDGREVTIHMVNEGELFAEIVLFERDTYPVSAVAVEDCRLTVIHRRRVHRALEDAEFRADFIHNLVSKMRFLSQQLYVMATMDVRSRLVRFLEVRCGRRNSIRIDLSKKETAAAISVRPETLSRTLATLQDEGLLTWKGKQITVDPNLWAEGER